MILSPKNTYVSIDIEADGPRPGRNSMMSFGVVAYTHDGQEIDSLHHCLLPFHNGKADEETMKWWATNPKAFKEWTRTIKRPPSEAIKNLDKWLTELPSLPILFAGPASWDGMWINWYAQEYLSRYLCSGFSILDIRSFVSGLLQQGYYDKLPATLKTKWNEIRDANPLPHHALHDAREQGQQFFEAIKYATTERVYNPNIDDTSFT